MAIIILFALLFFPVLALLRLAQFLNVWFLFGYAGLISLSAYFIYGHDKKQAVEGRWRIKESTLHALELFGGWPGAFLAQRVFRHKTSKTGYQATFWMVIAFHEFVAYDSMQNWVFLKKAIQFLGG